MKMEEEQNLFTIISIMRSRKRRPEVIGRTTMNHEWIYTPEQIKDSPSKKLGMSTKEEDKRRREGVKMITSIGKSLALKTNPTLATACVFFHRFYMAHSFQEFPRELTALGALFLAGKVEETPKKCSQIVLNAKVKYRGLYEGYRNLLDEVMGIERVMLKTLHFDLAVDHPYVHLLQYAKRMQFSEQEKTELVQAAWAFVNDAFGTTLCLLWEPQIIAIALLSLALKYKSKTQEKEEWWDQLVANLSSSMVEEVCHKVLDYYSAVKSETYSWEEQANTQVVKTDSPAPRVK